LAFKLHLFIVDARGSLGGVEACALRGCWAYAGTWQWQGGAAAEPCLAYAVTQAVPRRRSCRGLQTNTKELTP